MTVDINLVLTIVAVTWHYSLFCGFISDDHSGVCKRKDIIPDDEKKDRGESFWVKRFNDGIVIFYMNEIFWALGARENAFIWHLASFLIHLANVWLINLFLMPIIGDQAALMAACFWGISPMLNQNVVWISGRPYSLGLFLALIAANCWPVAYAFIPFYLLAVITNITIVFIPIILWLVYPNEWQTKAYLATMILGAMPFIIWKFNKRFTKGLVIDRDNFKFTPRKFNTLARMVLYYVWTIFVPVRMGWYHQAGFRYNERWEKFNYLTLIGYWLTAFLALNCGVGGWIFLLGLMPSSNLWATNSFLVDRYLYFPAIGIGIIVAPLLIAHPELFWMAFAFYGSRAYMYSRQMKDDEKLYRENWRNHPKSDFAINNLSYFLIQRHRHDEARVVIEQGIHINPMNRMLWYNLGITYASQGHFQNDEGKFKYIKALEAWNRALKIDPRWDKPANDLRRLIMLLVKNKVLTMDKGEAALGLSIQLPDFPEVKEALYGTKPSADSAIEDAQIVATQTNPSA